MRNKTYRITFTGIGAMNSRYENQVMEMEIRHDWSYNDREAESVMFIIREKIKEHFRHFELHSVEQI